MSKGLRKLWAVPIGGTWLVNGQSVEEDPSGVFSDTSDRIQRLFRPAPGLTYSH